MREDSCPRCRLAPLLSLALCAAALGIDAAAARQAAPSSDWLAFAPADACLYVEFRDLSRIREQFNRLGIWAALQAVSDRTELSPASRNWQRESRRFLGMSREQAITRLLGRRTALIARDPRRWKQGLVLAELQDVRAVREILTSCGAEPSMRVGDVQVFDLPGRPGLRLAQRGNMLLFGAADDADSLWTATIELMAGRAKPRLLGAAPIAQGLRRVRSAWDGLAVLRWGKHDWAVAAMRFEPTRTEVEIETSAADLPATQTATAHTLVQRLPQDAYAVWSGRIGVEASGNALSDGDDGGLFRGALRLAAQWTGADASGDAALGRFGPEIALGLHGIRVAGTPSYTAPALSLFIETPDATPAVQDFSRLAGIVAALINTQMARAGLDASPLRIERSTLEDGRILHRLPLGDALAQYTHCPFLRDVELVWAAADRCLIVTTSAELARALLAQRATTTSAASSPSTRPAPDADACEWLYVNGAPIADMVQSWLLYVQRVAPHVFRTSWWAEQSRRRARAATPFGVTLRGHADDGEAQAVVLDVEPNAAAAAILRPGDVIVGVEGRPLTTSRPAREVAEAFRDRAADDVFEVEIIREGARRSERVALPVSVDDAAEINPVRAAWPVIVIGRCVASLETATYQREDGGRHLRAIVTWQRATASRPRR